MIACIMFGNNEEKYLEGCINSVIPHVDYILLCCNGSEDTNKINFKWSNYEKVRYFYRPWGDKLHFDYGKARNEMLECIEEFADLHHARRVLMFMDPDERLECVSGFRKYVENAIDDDIHGLGIQIFAPSTGIDGNTKNHWTYFTRIWRGDQGYKFMGRVHETVAEEISRAGKNLKKMPAEVGRIVHLGYDINPSEIKLKAIRNMLLIVEELKDNPHSGYWYGQAGRTYATMGDYKMAVQCYEKALKQNDLSEEFKLTVLHDLPLLRKHLEAKCS